MVARESSETNKIVRTTCQAQNCYVGCGILAHVSDGKVLKIEGDKAHPRNYGEICVKATTFPELHHHEKRLLYPLRRTAGEFVRVSRNEALDEAAERFGQIIKESGPQAVAIVIDGLSLQIPSILLARSFGNPNIMDIIDYCEGPSVIADSVTVGEAITEFASDVRTCIEPGVTDCVVLWGSNPFVTNLHIRQRTLRCIEQGAKLIVIDPVYTVSARRADSWLQVRPGTDAALALGMINTVIEEGAYDKPFVENYCHGFEALKNRARDYPLDRVEEITGVPRGQIREAALVYANAQAAYTHSRLGLMQQRNATQTARAVTCLIAITGNIEKPGTHLLNRTHNMLTLGDMAVGEEWRLPKSAEAKMFGREKYPLHSEYNFLSHNPTMLRAMIDGQIRAAYVAGVNPIGAFPEARKVQEAFAGLEFLVVVDMFMSPTAQLAHLVLPTTDFLERNEIANDDVTRYVSARTRVVDAPGECRDDYEIAHEIAKRMGTPKRFFPCETREELDESRLGKLGLSMTELNRDGFRELPIEHGLHQVKGFATPSGKVELYSTVFERHGYDPLPGYDREPVDGEPADVDAHEFPFVFVARRDVHFQNSSGRQAQALRKHVQPVIEIHPNLARQRAISEGQWVTIKTPFGQIRQRVKFNSKVREDVVAGLTGAWDPEGSDREKRVFAYNVNVLTSQTAHRDPIAGVPALKNIPCNIYPVK
jgi:anaerobic selenocysteine-containing dehydrogenase